MAEVEGDLANHGKVADTLAVLRHRVMRRGVHRHSSKAVEEGIRGIRLILSRGSEVDHLVLLVGKERPMGGRVYDFD